MFPPPGNDTIQPLEKSASKYLICNARNFVACGLQIFDAGGGGEKTAPEKAEWALKRLPGHAAKSAGFRRNPRRFTGSRIESGQPGVVAL